MEEPIQQQYLERNARQTVSLRPRDVVISLHTRHRALFDTIKQSRTFTTMQCFRVGFYVLACSRNGKVTIETKEGETQTLDFWQIRA